MTRLGEIIKLARLEPSESHAIAALLLWADDNQGEFRRLAGDLGWRGVRKLLDKTGD